MGVSLYNQVLTNYFQRITNEEYTDDQGVIRTREVTTHLDSLSKDQFLESLKILNINEPSQITNLFETLDLNGDKSLTPDEMQRAIMILLNVVDAKGDPNLIANDWKKLTGEGGALEFIHTRKFCGLSLMSLFALTGDTSDTKKFFQIDRTEFDALIKRLELFENWKPSAVINKKYATDLLWSIFRDGKTGVIEASNNFGQDISFNVVQSVKSPRFKTLLTQLQTLSDSDLTKAEIESFAVASLGATLDTFLMEFYRQQQRIYDKLSESFKKM